MGSSIPIIQLAGGLIFVNPIGGNQATNPTAGQPYTFQDAKIESKGTIAKLRGQNQYPDDEGKTDLDGAFEFSMGRDDFFLINNIFFGDTVASGGTSVYGNFAASVPGSISYVITITPPSSGVFAADLGVFYANTGGKLTKVAPASEAAGKYSVNASTGVYTFAAADASAALKISYSYTVTSGNTYQVNQQLQGYGPTVELYFVDTYAATPPGPYPTTHLYSAKVDSVTKSRKRADYEMVDIKGGFFPLGSGASAGRVIDFFNPVG